ncbi:MAG: hypothetical protein JKX94_00135, partial [Sneathiella sp.]|nr:hypothetical protein [Sneathiella sp.]
RFFLPKPFSRGVIVWGDPVDVPRHDEKGSYEIARKKIEDSLTLITQKADDLCYQPRVEPDAVSASEKSRNKVL